MLKSTAMDPTTLALPMLSSPLRSLAARLLVSVTLPKFAQDLLLRAPPIHTLLPLRFADPKMVLAILSRRALVLLLLALLMPSTPRLLASPPSIIALDYKSSTERPTSSVLPMPRAFTCVSILPSELLP